MNSKLYFHKKKYDYECNVIYLSRVMNDSLTTNHTAVLTYVLKINFTNLQKNFINFNIRYIIIKANSWLLNAYIHYILKLKPKTI